MIATEDDRKLVGFKYRFNINGELFAGVADLAHVFQFLALLRKNLRPLESHIAEVANRIAEPRNALRQTRDAQRGRTDIDASHARAVAQRHSENCHAVFDFRVHYFTKVGCDRSFVETESSREYARCRTSTPC